MNVSFRWKKFVVEYPASEEPKGEIYPLLQMIFDSKWLFRGSIIISKEGLYFYRKGKFFKKIGSFLISWSEVEMVRRKENIFGKKIYLYCKTAAGIVRVAFPKFAEDDLRKYFNANNSFSEVL